MMIIQMYLGRRVPKLAPMAFWHFLLNPKGKKLRQGKIRQGRTSGSAEQINCISRGDHQDKGREVMDQLHHPELSFFGAHQAATDKQCDDT